MVRGMDGKSVPGDGMRGRRLYRLNGVGDICRVMFPMR